MCKNYLIEFIPTIFTTDELELEYNSTISALKLHSCTLSLRELKTAVEVGLKAGLRSKVTSIFKWVSESEIPTLVS